MEEELESRRSNLISSLDPRKNQKNFFFFIVIAVFLVVGGGVFVNNAQKTSRQVAKIDKKDPPFTSLASKTLVYGYWTDKNSFIEATDLRSGKIYSLATLDLAVKKVIPISPGSIIFINKTDTRDYGKEISIFDFASKTSSPIVPAADGYGIDDYVVSPNKKYLATWEISVPENSQGLIGGSSRVYTIDLNNPQRKNLIHDELITTGSSMHYPLAITNTGELFMDRFEPNNQAGWGNGVSVSDFLGISKVEISSMSAGSLASQPVLSPDGNKLVFAGYDGSNGSGDISVLEKEGFKQDVLNPNTIDVFDILSKQRTKLSGIPNTNRYPSVSWDPSSNKIIYFALSKNQNQDGFYLYDPVNSSTQKLRDETEASQDFVLSTLESGKILTGVNNTSVSTVGNLGEKYSQSLNEIAIYDASSKERKPINIGKNIIQYISLLPSSYFSDALVTGNLGASSDENVNRLQLKTIVFKTELGPKRIIQQSEMRCRDLASQQCNSMLGTNFIPGQFKTSNSEYNVCMKSQFKIARTDGACMDSPLYLYGKPGAYIKINIDTQIYGSNAPHKSGYYEGFLTGDGGLKIENQSFSNISFDYTPFLRRLPRLNYGKSVKSDEVAKTLEEYGEKLGLNSVEIKDLISSVGKQSSPYVFVSFFNDETSKIILPISFDPMPDLYRNIVFYLRPLEAPLSIKEPQFEKVLQRKGLTAIEVSFIIDK